MLALFLPLFLILLLIGVPVFFAMLVAPGFILYINGQERDLALMYRNIFNGMDNGVLLAIPFFMLAGELMNRGGITERLVTFSQAIIGSFRGGLAQVNILSSMLFAGMSGSAVADTSALGSMLIPAMEKEGYTRKFSAAITAASSVIGPIIPPSGIMIIYAYVMEVSVAALFAGGVIPGILVGLGLMIVTRAMANHYDFPPAKKVVFTHVTISPFEDISARIITRILLAGAVYPLFAKITGLGETDGWTFVAIVWVLGFISAELFLMLQRRLMSEGFRIVSKRAILPLLTPVIILGGILGGVATPTEASALAVAYAAFLGLVVLKTLKISDLSGVLSRAAIISGVVLLLVGAAMAFKTVVSLSHAAEDLANMIVALTNDPIMLLFLINILLFVVGMFLDAGPAIIILGPILAPIFINMGVHPVHFAMIMSVNLTVGLATPPMGLVLFVASAVSGVKVEAISRAILPFLAVEVFVIFLITYFPVISLGIPTWLGFVKDADLLGPILGAMF
ncbi:MAG: TRAP transporter large permease [Rhizobiales bacterium]|nr:TRAP transporter large permease [Hyphomicrobiales bacterium]NRB13334.1 TRAP transporter large permease [Hyphomicrobiales bacterium]